MISIRKYRPDDAGRITEIYNHYITHTTITFETEPLTVEEMSARLDSIAAAASQDMPMPTSGNRAGLIVRLPKRRSTSTAVIKATAQAPPCCADS